MPDKTPAQYLKDKLKESDWEYSLVLKVRFRDRPVIAKANRRLAELRDALDLVIQGWSDRISGEGCLGEYEGWEEEMKRHEALRAVEVDSVPDWHGKKISKKAR